MGVNIIFGVIFCRCAHQNEFFLEAVHQLKSNEAMIIMDYKQKMLERQYREKMGVYFGKKGISLLGFMVIRPRDAPPFRPELLPTEWFNVVEEPV